MKIANCGLRIANLERQSIRNPKSEIRNSNGERYLVGGVDSPVRAFRQVGGDPLVLVRGRGVDVIDDGGTRYLDFIMGWGALILGHNHPAVIRALRQGMTSGVMMGLTHPGEFELARLIVEAVPSVEQVRFTVSGTEACMTAVRLARAHTGRAKIVTFDGCYHGHGDSLMARKSTGLLAALEQAAITVPFNDFAAVEQIIRRQSAEIACVIIEPVAANMGVVAPEAGYLQRIRELTQRHGTLLIFDEVVTGFRLGLGGAQQMFGVSPDLTTFGKIIGGGLPIGAVGGPRRLMQRLAPEGDVYHGGTFAGHPLSMAAGIAALNELRRHPPHERLERLAERLASGLLEGARRHHVSAHVNRVGSMLTLLFSETPVRNFAHAKASHRERFAQWANALRRQGILIPPSPFEALFVSTTHTVAHIERFVRVSSAAFELMH